MAYLISLALETYVYGGSPYICVCVCVYLNKTPFWLCFHYITCKCIMAKGDSPDEYRGAHLHKWLSWER